MELIIQLIFEGILYIIGDGVYDKEESKKYSPKMKLVLMIICTIIYGAMSIIFLGFIHEMENLFLKVTVVACTIGFMIMIVVGWIKTIKAFKQSVCEEDGKRL